MLAAERRNIILEKLQEEKKVVVSELSQLFEVSEETIRRDLDKLDKDGLAVKSYGGAVINEDSGIDMPFNVRRKHNVAEKQKIAKLTAQVIHDGDSVMLDASSTAIYVAKAIKKCRDRMRVVTNSLEIVVELSDMPGWTVISTGGQVKEGYLALLGDKALAGIRDYYADIAVISCKGLSENGDFMDSNISLASVKEAMLKSSKKRILVLDNSKFEKTAFSRIGTLKDIDILITDGKPSKSWAKLLERWDVQCLYPKE